MNSDDNPQPEQEHLTRAQYRRQMRHGRHHQTAEDDEGNESQTREGFRKSQREEHGFHKPERGETAQATADRKQRRSQESGPESTDETGQPNRAASLAMDKQALAEEKSQRLAKRLNIAIAILVVLIVIVYLILFFVK